MQASFQDFSPKERNYHLFIISSVPPSITSDRSWGPGWRLLRRSVGISLRLQVELWGINNRRSPRKYCSFSLSCIQSNRTFPESERGKGGGGGGLLFSLTYSITTSQLCIYTHMHTLTNKPTSIYSRCTTEQSIKHQGNGRMKLTFRPSSAQNNSEDA